MPAVLIPLGQYMLLDEWLRNNYPYLYGNDTGETQYWKDLSSARYFVDQRLITQNLRLTEEQKVELLALSESAYQACYTWWNPFDAGDEVTCYYNAISVSFPPIVGDSDPNINQILGLSTEGVAQATDSDVSGSESVGVPDGESNLPIPWWAYVLGAIGLYAAVKK